MTATTHDEHQLTPHRGGAWRLLFASRYAGTRLAVEVAASAVTALPAVPGAYDSSLWLERV